MLAKLEDQQFLDGAEVIAFEQHVDYWNHDGWIDPFSAAEWTQRQRDYAAVFKLDGVYTPQMVIDGREQFVGTHIREVSNAILNNARVPKAELTITESAAEAKEPRHFKVNVTNLTAGATGDSTGVYFAITEKGLHSEVDRGENAGKHLHHASIVRWMRKIGLANGKASTSPFSAEAAVKLKPTWNVDNLRAVAFVQERRSRRMLGAASVKISR